MTERTRLALSLLLLLAAAPAAAAQQAQNLPDLHAVKTVTLSPSYSCRPKGESAKGYEGAALFLSGHSKQRNSPDLLFNGACRSADYFHASTAGDDMALVADLGRDVKVEYVTAQAVFHELRRELAPPLIGPTGTSFTARAPVKLGHTYAVLLNKSHLRGLFLFTVTDYVPNGRVTLRYAVKEYQVLRAVAESPGFDWGKPSTPR